jgi:YVTN family beta-propeller protein
MGYKCLLALLLSFCFFSTATYAIPVVANVNPAVGPSTGGTAVVISGSGFTGATAVNFGTFPAAAFFVNSDSSITAMAPPHAPGVVTVFVTTSSGTSAVNNDAFFTFQGDWQVYTVNLFDTLTAIDAATDTVNAEIPIGFLLFNMDFLPDGTLGFVNAINNTIPVINTATNTVVNTIPPISSHIDDPVVFEMLPNGAKNYIPLFVSNALAIINNATETQNPNVPVGTSPENITLLINGTRAYVLNSRDGTVSVIDTSNDTVIATITVGSNPLTGMTTPDGTKLYVANFNDNTVSVIDTSSNTVIATIPVGTGPTAVAITPDGTQVYISNQNDNTVSAIVTASNTVAATIPVGANPNVIVITPDSSQAYVINLDDSTISVIDTASNTVTATIPIGVGSNPFDEVITPDGKKLFVSDSNADLVSVIDTSTNTVIDTIPVGDFPSYIGITADQAPLAQYTVIPQTVGLPTIFDASSSVSPTGTIVNYFWNFGDGSPTVSTTNPIVTHVYQVPGNFFATLIVTNSAGTSTNQIFYFSSSNSSDLITAGPVVLNNGGPTAIRVRLVTIGLVPPSNFIGCVKTNEFLNKTEHVLKAIFTASPSPGVVLYQIFENGVLVKEIPATASTLSFQLCLKSKQSAKGISVVAVGPGGAVSAPVPITIVGSCCSIHDLVR